MSGDGQTNGTADVTDIDLTRVLDSLSFDGEMTPTPAEAAAVAAAVGSHLSDRERVTAADGDSPTDSVNSWRLAGRMDRVGAGDRRRPRSVQRGDEWRAAARSL